MKKIKTLEFKLKRMNEDQSSDEEDNKQSSDE